MSENNIVDLSRESESALHWTPLQMLESEVEALKSGERQADKAFVIFLQNDGDGGYNMGYGNAKLTLNDIITLLELTKLHMASNMGVI